MFNALRFELRLADFARRQVNVEAEQKFNRKLDPIQTADSLRLTTVG